MAYEIHFLIDGESAPTDAATRFDDWYQNHTFVLPDREQQYTHHDAREDGTLQAYGEARVYLSLQADQQAAIDALAAQYPDADWLAINTRRTDTELGIDPWQSDPAYYDPAVSDGLRASISPEFVNHTLSHGEIEYVFEDDTHSIPAGEYVFDEPSIETGPYTQTLYADDTGSVTERDGTEIATVEVHPGRIVDIDAATQPRSETDWTTAVSRGSPPTHFADETADLPDPLPADYLDRNRVSDSEIAQIYQAIDSHPDDQTAGLAEAIVDIVFGGRP